jgi:hypothetical protein
MQPNSRKGARFNCCLGRVRHDLFVIEVPSTRGETKYQRRNQRRMGAGAGAAVAILVSVMVYTARIEFE